MTNLYHCVCGADFDTPVGLADHIRMAMGVHEDRGVYTVEDQVRAIIRDELVRYHLIDGAAEDE